MTVFIKNKATLKNLFILLPLFLFSASFLNAQTQATEITEKVVKKVRKATKFKTGDVELKVGYGFIPMLQGKGSESLVAPVSASLSVRVNPRFSIGAYAGYTSNISAVKEQRDGSAYQYQNDFLVLGLKGQAHILAVDNFDFYGGAILAYNKPFVTTTTISTPTANGELDIIPSTFPTPHNPNGPSASMLVSGYVGGAYYITKNFNVYGEVGYGVSLATVGLGYKF